MTETTTQSIHRVLVTVLLALIATFFIVGYKQFQEIKKLHRETIIQAIQTGHACARAGVSEEMCVMRFKKTLRGGVRCKNLLNSEMQ